MVAPLALGLAALAYRAYRAYKVVKKVRDAARVAKQVSQAAKAGRSVAKATRTAKQAKSTFQKTKQSSRQTCPKAVAASRTKAVREAWKKEQDLVRRTGRGTRNWTKAEKKELLETGKVKGYEGHHINSVKDNPHLAGDPRNIKFVKGRAEHLKEHGGNFRNPTQGNLIKR